MIRIEGQPILTAAAMRAAEDRAIAAGSSIQELMERAGRGVAEQVRRLASGAPVLILCGPGNNGGDGYVAARMLRAAGAEVRVAALGEPRTEAAAVARRTWTGAVEAIDAALPAPVLVDAVFGTGLSRPLEPALRTSMARLVNDARLAVAVDVPSGIDTDSGAALGCPAGFNLTLALGAVKPAHLLEPAANLCGEVRLLDIGAGAESDTAVLDRPELAPPGADAHKYSRGFVAVIGGAMPGAGELAALAAARAGAGYVMVLGGEAGGFPHAIVRRPFAAGALDDPRIGAVVIGPGLGRDAAATRRLHDVLATDRPLVIDGDALHLLDISVMRSRTAPMVLTPHAGEFAALFGTAGGSKIDRARAAAKAVNAIVVFKGADTVIAAPDGRVRIGGNASTWLSTAGTGDVLAGAVGAMLASGRAPFEAACAGVWLHGAASRALGPAFLADDLAEMLGTVRPA